MANRKFWSRLTLTNRQQIAEPRPAANDVRGRAVAFPAPAEKPVAVDAVAAEPLPTEPAGRTQRIRRQPRSLEENGDFVFPLLGDEDWMLLLFVAVVAVLDVKFVSIDQMYDQD